MQRDCCKVTHVVSNQVGCMILTPTIDWVNLDERNNMYIIIWRDICSQAGAKPAFIYLFIVMIFKLTNKQQIKNKNK